VNSVSGAPAPTGLLLDNIGDVTITSPTAGQTLFYSGGEWVNGTASGGGTPATPDRGIQFNSGGSFAADSNFVYTSKGYLGLGTASPAGTLHVDGGTSTTGAGADITLTAQRAVAAGGLGGDVFITAGAGESWGDGGNITLSAGRGNASTGMGGYGGSLTLNGGFAPGSPGVAILKGGNAANGFGSGGIITLNSTGSTSGGSVTIVGGNGNSVPGNGGNILIDGGLKSGAGTDGNVILGSVRGNVGIGTVSPLAQLDVGGTGSMLMPRGDTSQRPASPVNGMIRYNSQNDKFEGYQAGSWQDIVTGSVTGTFAALTDTPASYAGSSGYFVKVNVGESGLTFSSNLINNVSGEPAPVGLGLVDLDDVTITSPTAGQTLFYSGGQWVNGAGGGGAPAGANTQIQFNSGGSFGGSGNLTWDGTTFAVTGDITYSGTITDVSDRRLKTDILALNDRGSMLEKIGMIDTYSFRMKNNPEAGVEFGVMAQDIQKIFPELVRTDKSTPESYLSVNYVGMIAPMIEATKELKAENETLKAELAAVKADREQMVTALNDLSRDVKGLKAHTGYGVDKAGFEFWMMIMAAVIIGASATLLVIGSMRQSRKRG
jgi:hypothetical protein